MSLAVYLDIELFEFPDDLMRVFYMLEIVNNGRDTTRNSFHNVHPGHGRQAKPLFSKRPYEKSATP